MAEIIHSGQNQVGTLGGQVRLEEGAGRLVIYDGTKELVVIDETGFMLSDGTNRRIKIGAAPSDGRVGIWQSKPGIDVIDELSN